MSTTPDRPPQSVAGTDNPFAGWDDVPLFMKSLPAEQGGQRKQDAPDDNATLDALAALMYEGTATEIAAGLKEQANELFAAKKYRDAIGFYTRAIDEVGKELGVEDRRVLWCNRAAANLELGNYGATLKDTALVISAPADSFPDAPSAASNKTTLKALLRSARALNGLEKLPEALDALHRMRILEVSLGEEEKDLGKAVRELVEGKVVKKERREQEIKEKARREKEGEKAIQEALLRRGLVLPRKTASQRLFANCPIDVKPPHFDPNVLPPQCRSTLPLLPPLKPNPDVPFITWVPPDLNTPLNIPAFLLFPLNDPPSRDLCLTFPTESTFGDFILSMDHDPSLLNLYISTTSGKVLKIGPKLNLGKVIQGAKDGPGSGWELREGWALEIMAVPKGDKGDQWIVEWKQQVKANAISIL